MDFNTWLIYLLAAIGLSLSPGPNGLLALTHGALHGRRKALYTIFGGAFGFVAVIALSIYHGAFFSEVIRAGLNAIPRGQLEAARSARPVESGWSHSGPRGDRP